MPLRRTNEMVATYILSYLDNKSVLQFGLTSKLHRLISRHAALWASVELSSSSEIGIDVVSELVSRSNNSLPLKKLVINCNIDSINFADTGLHQECCKSESLDSPIELTNKLNVLIVEDNVTLIKAAKLYFDQNKHTTTIAPDGLTALNLMKNNEYDLVIIEINITVMGAYEVAKAIRDYEEKNKPNCIQFIVGTSVGILHLYV